MVTSSLPSSLLSSNNINNNIITVNIYLSVAVIKTIDMITNAHKSPKGWILVVSPLCKRGNWGSDDLSSLPMFTRSLSDGCGERDRVVWGMVPEAFSGLPGKKPAGTRSSPSSSVRDYTWCHLLLMSSIGTIPSMHLAWTASSRDTDICSLLARLFSHLLQ